MPRPSRLTVTGTALYGTALLLIGLWPTHVDKNIDVVAWPPVQWMMRNLDITPLQAYDFVEIGANVVLFAPLGLFVMVWLSRARWFHAVGLGLVLSGAIEIVQDVARPDRTASWVDVLANTAGAALGAAFVVIWRQQRQAVV
ncbi:VanZ family protein [Aeromicrobium sp. 9AM]|uniref:VanZ family protein n=1 Tax=Aeromicrobium sp. 9AM TaxID=2653126 RepID=UPI0012EFC34B|nr:VanZ family protein [Aeromicrobium sp. 9AM]VXB52752.1 VanZ family protein [Aeromicrobium sp. 9AM]